jgi:hypothetical protein
MYLRFLVSLLLLQSWDVFQQTMLANAAALRLRRLQRLLLTVSLMRVVLLLVWMFRLLRMQSALLVFECKGKSSCSNAEWLEGQW